MDFQQTFETTPTVRYEVKNGPCLWTTTTAFPLHVILTANVTAQRVEPQMSKNTSPQKLALNGSGGPHFSRAFYGP